MLFSVLVGAFAASTYVYGAFLSNSECEVRARTNAGWVCGVRRYDVNGEAFASFTNVPYAQQPLGELRFKELQPLQPWDYLYDATKLGPICPQRDFLFDTLMTNPYMSEACIHANVYVPLQALPTEQMQYERRSKKRSVSLPIIVFCHGGGFVSGSSDPDLYGPEYLVAEDIIVITFNYRLNVFGYLSLNTPSIPGNNGLRDAVTLLRWVRSNAHNFGGNPFDVTIAGQSSGGVIANLMVLSRAAEGLFQRAIIMSGVASRSFYSASPKHAEQIANSLLSKLNIVSNDPDEIHHQLIEMPLEILINATVEVHIENAPVSFSPVVEEHFPGITTVLDEDPECLILGGRGNNIPFLVGFANLEQKFFRNLFQVINAVERVKNNPLNALSQDLTYKLPEKSALFFGNITADRYFGDAPTLDKFLQCFADFAFIYPTIKFIQLRTLTTIAPTYLYQFSYNASFSAIKYSKNLTFDGATHCDDIPTIFKTNALNGVPGIERPAKNDLEIRRFMIQTVKNFIRYNTPSPVCAGDNGVPWPPQSRHSAIKYENIYKPNNIFYSDLTREQIDAFNYFDYLYTFANSHCPSSYGNV